MKILHIGSNSTHVITYINDFKIDGVEHFYMGNENLEISNCRKTFTINFKYNNPFKLYKSYKQGVSILRELKPSVIHIHQVTRNSFWISKIAKKEGVKVVLTAWGSDVLVLPFINKLYYYIVKKTLQNANIITADAKVMISKMKEIVPNKHYEWIQYGIQLVKPKLKEKVIFSNRLHKPLYNIGKIIDLFSEFSKSFPDYHLKIAANGPDTETLAQIVKEYKLESKISFLGWLSNEENRKQYESALIYITIPASDGTSVSLLEAMSAGCIPVVSNIPANREWIVDGDNGIVLKENINPFIEAVELDNEEVSRRNNELVQKVTRENSIASFYQFYKDLS